MISFLMTGLTGRVIAQNTGATARIDKSAILIGEQVKFELTVTLPAGSKVQWPLMLDTLTQNVEILRKTGLDTVSSDNSQFTLKQELIITSFDSGYYVIKPILFKYNRKGDTLTYITETPPVALEVQTIQTDESKDIMPIKPPLRAPVTFRELMPWIGLVLIVLLIATLAYYYFKKRKKVLPVAHSRLKPSIPPYEAAIEALEGLRLKKLWQAGKTKEYYSEMTDIIREYIELRFPVRALEMTTEEINAALRKTEVNASARDKLYQVLLLADLVKFAKEQPLPLENDLCLSQCLEFVRETKPARDSEPAQAETNVNTDQPESK